MFDQQIQKQIIILNPLGTFEKYSDGNMQSRFPCSSLSARNGLFCSD